MAIKITAMTPANVPLALSDLFESVVGGVTQSHSGADLIAGNSARPSVIAVSTALLNGTYNNGTAGVGATFTYTATGAQMMDGQAVVAGSDYLIRNNGIANGIYRCTVTGSVGVATVLTRRTDFNNTNNILTGTVVFATGGTVNGLTSWIMNLAGPIVVGSDEIPFVMTYAAPLATDANSNTIIGPNSGSPSLAVNGQYVSIYGDNNLNDAGILDVKRTSAIGSFNLRSLQTGTGNFAWGFNNLSSLVTGDDNVAIGDSVFINLGTGSKNIGISTSVTCGVSYTTNETGNIIIGGSSGQFGEDYVTRIGYVNGGGNTPTQTACFLDGVAAVAASTFTDGRPVFVEFGTGQLSYGVDNCLYQPIATKTTGYTLALADVANFQILNSASALVVTIPLNATVAFPIGTTFNFFRQGAGSVTFTATGGVTLLSKASAITLSAQYVGGCLKKIATNTWLLVGDLA